jgi:hypothetical protein
MQALLSWDTGRKSYNMRSDRYFPRNTRRGESVIDAAESCATYVSVARGKHARRTPRRRDGSNRCCLEPHRVAWGRRPW